MITNTFNILSLSIFHIDHFMALQDRVYDSLPDTDKLFIVRRSRETLKEHFAKNMPVLGAFAGDNLISATCVSYPSEYKMKNYILACKRDINPDDLSIIESVYVCPDYRQLGIATQMTKKACSSAFEVKRPQIIAEIADGNIASIRTFEKIGFNKAGTYISPKDKCKVIMMANREYLNFG